MVSRSPGRESGFSTKRKGVFHVAKMAVLVPYAEMRDMARPMAARYGYLSPMCIEYAETAGYRAAPGNWSGRAANS